MRALSTALLAIVVSASNASAADQLNVLFIAIDDLVPTLGVYGDSIAQTSEIDTIASLGTTFLNHHVQWSVCGPSRASMSTSLMPEETGVTGFKPIRDLLPDVVTLPEHFKNNGYETACAGKFHDNRTVGTFDLNGDLNADGKTVDDPASWSIGYNSAGGSGFSPTGKPAIDYTDQADSAYVDHDILTTGLAHIDTIAAGSKPFFLAVGFKKPHLGFYAPKQYWDMYDTNNDDDYTNDMPLASFTSDPANASANVVDMLDFNNELLGYDEYIGADNTVGTADDVLPTDAQARELKHGYYACVSFIDALVGQLVDKLEVTADPVQAGKMMSETTIIVVWGDHGFYLGQHNKWAKHTNLEPATSAPLIIYDPRTPTTGAKSESPVNSLDIYPTLCELAGLPIPEQPISDVVTTGRPLRGRSLVPILEDADAMVHFGAVSQFNKGEWGYAYRTKRFRYIEWINGSNTITAQDLYDYVADPEETENLAADPAYASIVYQLSKALRAEPAALGMSRLQATPPISPPSELEVPFLGVNGVVAGDLVLEWPGAAGVTYRVLSTIDLATSFAPHSSVPSGDSIAILIDEAQEFFVVEIDDNTPPMFSEDPILGTLARVDSAYSATLLGTATDSDIGATLSYAKLAGAPWLQVAPNGLLTGTPQSADLGAQYFTVSATDNEGAVVQAKLQITVESALPAGTEVSFEPVADTYLHQANDTINYGTRAYYELRQEFGHANNFGRIALLRFDLTGIAGTVQSATLYLTPDTSTGATPTPETDNIAVYDLNNDSWDETTVTWSNAQSPGLFDDIAASATATLNNTGTGEQSVDITSLITGDGTYSIVLDEQANSLGRLYSRDETDSAKRPRLVVVYE
ncbi:MAG TPA: hypothetical protein DCX06_12605 [Opitutae bacterium]|nr:hypothetical protein [Opitutae bacterium]